MKKVLHITSCLAKNGTETFIMNVYKNIDRSKLQFDFLVFTESNDGYYAEAESLGANIYRLSPRKNSLFKYYMGLKDFMKNHVRDYVAVHLSGCTLSSILHIRLAKKYGCKRIFVHSHSTENTAGIHNLILHKFNKLFISKIATDYLACSEDAAKWFYGGTSAYAKRKIIKNGIDINVFKYNHQIRNQIRSELRFGDKRVYANISRFEKVKNHKFIIDVFYEILLKEPDSLLLLVGDGSLKKEITDYVESLNISCNVVFLGHRDDIPNILNAVDVILFPSFFEGIPFSLIEAQSVGLPIFTSTNVSINTQIIDSIFFLKLESGPIYWRNQIFNCLSDFHRSDKTIKIKEAGYSIRDTALDLEKMYLS